jgi:hypothetical protein
MRNCLALHRSQEMPRVWMMVVLEVVVSAQEEVDQ